MAVANNVVDISNRSYKTLDALDMDTEATKKDLRDGLRQRVEAAKKGAKDRASKEVENALNRMEEDLSNEDLVSAHIDRWIANQWLKASKYMSIEDMLLM
jgi:hypothetical protein